MVDIVGKRGWYFLFSALLILPGLLSMIMPPGGWSTLNSGLRPGIDFTSGSVMDITFTSEVTQGQIQVQMDALGHPEALVQSTGKRSVLIRTKQLREASGQERAERQLIQEHLEENVATIQSAAFDSISPIIAQETVRNTIFAMAAASLFILFFIWYAFRKAPKAYRYGVSAVVALLHDVLIVLGIFSILGRFFNVEVNTTFIIGILTVAGYSVNDTIVVFDRIRENVGRFQAATITELANLSVRETVGRSLNTSLTLLVVISALLLFGGPTIQPLLLVLLVGVIVGTYSSIFVATLMLVAWEEGELGRGLRRINPFGGRRPRRTA